MKYLLVLSILFCALKTVAQSNIVQELEREIPGKGRVLVNQPERLDSLMGSMVTANGKQPRVEGYRVLVYSGNNSAQARNEANEMAKYMKENFPGAEVYVVFEAPVRSCLYGDYRTREEAEAVMYRLKGTRKFKEISVKKCIINLPY
jgi:hypothetical protein